MRRVQYQGSKINNNGRSDLLLHTGELCRLKMVRRLVHSIGSGKDGA